MKISNLTGFGKKILTLLDDLQESKTSMEEKTADIVEKERDFKLEAKPEVVTELLQSHGKT
jgi:hypothetical protein